MTTDTRSKFEEFLSTCSDLLKGEAESAKFVALIQKRYENCTASFRHSPEMADLLEVTQDRMLADGKRIFVHIKDFVMELKAWTNGSGAQPHRKRKAVNPLEAVAKLSRTEDSSASDFSDIEGRLQRAVGDRTSASSPPCPHAKATSPSTQSSTTKTSCSSAEHSVLPSISVPSVNVPGANNLPLHGVCMGESSLTSSQAAEDSGNSNSAQGDRNSSKRLPRAVNNGGLNVPDSSGKIVRMSEKLNGSCELFGPNGDVLSDVRAPPPGTQDALNLHRNSGTAKLQVEDSKLKISRGKLRLPGDLMNASSTSSSDRTGTTAHPFSISSKSSGLIHTVDRLKSRLLLTSSPLPPCHSPPLFDMTCDDDQAKDDSDVIMIEDDDEEEEKIPDLKENSKQTASGAACTEMKPVLPGAALGLEASPGPIIVSVQGAGAQDLHKTGSGTADEGKVSKEEKRIKRLEKLLEEIRNKIEEVREKELSLDELENEDSSYIFEDRLQKKFIKVWNRLCQLKGRNTSSGRPIERRFKYEGTRFPEINRKIEKFVNRPDSFPDYHDIHGIVKKVNTRHRLGLSVNQINDISRETFLDVGESLQRRRHKDFISTFPCRQTMSFSSEQDPALFDPELRRKLDENQRIGKSRLEEVISKYSNLQTEMGEEAKQESDGSDSENLSKSESKEGRGKVKSGPKVTAEDAMDSLPASEDEAEGKGAAEASAEVTVKAIAEECDGASLEDEEDGAGMIELDVAEDSDLLEAYLPCDEGGDEDPCTMAEEDDPLLELHPLDNAGVSGDVCTMEAEGSHLVKKHLPGNEGGTEEHSTMAEACQVSEAHHRGNASVVKESPCDKAQLGVNGKIFLQNTDPKPVYNNYGRELREPALTGAKDGETDEGLQNAGLETLKQAAAGAKSSGSVSQTVDQLKHSNAGGGAGTFVKVNGDSLQRQGCDRGPTPGLAAATCDADPATSSGRLQSLPRLEEVTGLRLPLRKSQSPVKISTSLRLPRCLLPRNGGRPLPKTGTLFYPSKMKCASADENSDSVTVIDSSDEEAELGSSLKEEPFVKKEPIFEHWDDGGDVIVLSDSD